MVKLGWGQLGWTMYVQKTYGFVSADGIELTGADGRSEETKQDCLESRSDGEHCRGQTGAACCGRCRGCAVDDGGLIYSDLGRPESREEAVLAGG